MGASGPADHGSAIGDGIRRERLRRSLTLAQLAERVGLTVSALSQIERGVSDPSISSLRRIAAAFEMPMFRLLISPGERAPVIRRDQRVRARFPDRGLDYEVVAEDPSGTFGILSVVLLPGQATIETPAGHESDECALVLRGRMRIELGDEVHDLGAGDSVRIDRELPHRLSNPFDAPAEVLMVMSPPTF